LVNFKVDLTNNQSNVEFQ